ncbi:MAG: type II toxin-antitoxin system VapC family toxin [Betaproteobacteria bacterium]|nr:type II toxin-antitoxin system VapC family toxin [Betaproteobacteria bacterium]
MRVFFDSSALAKRYVDELGTAEVLAWCEKATELALSVIAIPELISAFCRLRRERKLSAGQYQRVKGELMADIADALVCDTTPQVVARSVQALERHRLRAMDAIHLGAALECEAEVFVSADARQRAAAKSMGLRVIAL